MAIRYLLKDGNKLQTLHQKSLINKYILSCSAHPCHQFHHTWISILSTKISLSKYLFRCTENVNDIVSTAESWENFIKAIDMKW